MTVFVSLSDQEHALWHERQRAKKALAKRDSPEHRQWLDRVMAEMDDLLDRCDRD